jgi:hypothetical protein
VKIEKKFCPVTLEPELEEAAALMTAHERRMMAKRLRRWARQLEVSAFILDRVYAPKPPPALKVLPARRLVLN